MVAENEPLSGEEDKLIKKFMVIFALPSWWSIRVHRSKNEGGCSGDPHSQEKRGKMHTVVTLFLAPGAVSLKWTLKKSQVGESNLFSELLDWITFIFPISNLHRLGINAIERFFRWSNLNLSFEAKTKMQTKKPHFA